MNISKRIALVGAIVAATAFGYAAPASAQATRTWVSGVGDDVNPCSRTAPCKTFAGAISKTAAGGEINCLDPGGFGAVSIIKSMTISCPYTEGGALAGGNGITVNMPATTDVTYIRGLDIFGVSPPSNGIRFVNQGSLHIEDSVIRRFNAASSAGISWAPTGANTELFISNTLVADNGNGATGGGIVLDPGATGGGKVTMRNVRVVNNANAGILIDVVGSTTALGLFVTIDGAVVSGNADGIRALHTVGSQGMTVQVNNSDISNNSGTGILGDGPAATIRVGNSTISGNATGVNRLNGSAVKSWGDNRLNANTTTDGTFLLPNLTKL
jgi:hypothetical protein